MSRKLVLVAWILRVVGILAMFAIVAAFMPLSWMASVHESIGLGKMPDGPIVEYLARSLSALYALLGCWIFYLSGRVPDQLGVVRLFGALFAVFGVVLWWVGFKSGLPIAWVLLEGPPSILLGLWIVYCCRGGESPTPSDD
jgi:hypothetical protein